MRRVLNAVKIGYWAFKNPKTLQVGNFKMLSSLFELICKVSLEDRHLMSHIAYVHPEEGEKQIVSIWAGAGIESSPTKRIKELIEENAELKLQLSSMIKN